MFSPVGCLHRHATTGFGQTRVDSRHPQEGKGHLAVGMQTSLKSPQFAASDARALLSGHLKLFVFFTLNCAFFLHLLAKIM